ncbi:hypothetical protein [Hazenella coriacea]|nr:hypothetical protein [Hazenella coriacea]
MNHPVYLWTKESEIEIPYSNFNQLEAIHNSIEGQRDLLKLDTY